MGTNTSKQKLLNLNDNDVKFFSFEGKTLDAKVSNIYDADTIYVIIELSDNTFYKFKIRLNRIDSPEIKPLKSCINRDLNISSAKKCKSLLSDMIMFKIVKLKCYDYDKYGRILADVIYNDVNINDLLLQNKLVKEYFGNKKTEWTLDELKYIEDFDVLDFKEKNKILFQ